MASLRIYVPRHTAEDWFPNFSRRFTRDVLARHHDVEFARDVGTCAITGAPQYRVGRQLVRMHQYSMAIEHTDSGAVRLLTTITQPLDMFVKHGFDPEVVTHHLTGHFVSARLRAGIAADPRLRRAWRSLEQSPLHRWLFRPLYWQTPVPASFPAQRRRGLYFRGSHFAVRDTLPFLIAQSGPDDQLDIEWWPLGEARMLPAAHYFADLANREMALSLAGSGDMCNRDIECFALGVPVIRPLLNAEFAVPIESGVHYIGVPYEPLGDGHPYPDHPKDHRQLAADILATYRRVRHDKELLEKIARNARAYYDANIAYPAIAEHTLRLLDLGAVAATGEATQASHRVETVQVARPALNATSSVTAAAAASAELRLVALLSRPLPPGELIAQANTCIVDGFDWDRLLYLVRFHGVIPQVAAALELLGSRGDPFVTLQVRQARLALAATEIQTYAQWQQLCRALDAAGIHALTLQGFHSAYAIYGDRGRRVFDGLDFLVSPDDVAATLELLGQHGFAGSEEWQRALRNVDLPYALSRSEMMTLVREDGLVLRIHWATSPARTALPLAEMMAAAIPTPAPDASARGPALSDLLLLHLEAASAQSWGQLSLLADVAEGLERLDSAGVARLRERLIRIDGLSTLADAIALMRRLWGVSPERIVALGALPDANRRLVDAVVARWERTGRSEPHAGSLSLLARVRDRLPLPGHASVWLASALRTTPHDWAVLPLPAPLRLGYYFVRPLRLALHWLGSSRRTAHRHASADQGRLTATAMRPPIRVVIPTHGRSPLLARTLQSLAASRLPEEYVETIVVENGSDEGARQTVIDVAAARPALRVRYLHVPVANKSHALNSALEGIGDGLVIFFDDDVRFEPGVLEAYAFAAAKAGPGHFFGGPTSCDFETTPPDWMLPLLPASARGYTLEEAQQAGYFLGFNWAAFAQDIHAAGGFDAAFGPGSATGARGQESDMQLRLRSLKRRGIGVQDARVWHYVPAERCTPNWTIARSYESGLGRGMMSRGIMDGLAWRGLREVPINVLQLMIGRLRNRDEQSVTARVSLAFWMGCYVGLFDPRQQDAPR